MNIYYTYIFIYKSTIIRASVYIYIHIHIEDLFVYIYTYTYVLWKRNAYIDSMCMHIYITLLCYYKMLYIYMNSVVRLHRGLSQTYPASKPVMEIDGGKNVVALVKS